MFIFFIGSANASSKEKVTFSKCVDGDTIKVNIDGEINIVRMLAIDTPESVHPTKGVEYYGKEASNYELVKNGYAEVAYLYGDYKYTNTLKDHQAVAEASKIGIWNEEARKEFDSNSSSKNDDNTTDNSDSYIDLKNMSTSDIIIVIGVVIIGIVLGPTIKKIKRKIKKYTK